MNEPESFYEIDESQDKYAIEKLRPGSEEMKAVWTKNFTLYQTFANYWKPRIEMGKKCENFLRRDIFSRGQRMKYLHLQDKWPIEPQEVKPVVDSLMSQISLRVRSGAVTMDDDTPPPNAAPPEVVNVVLQWIEKTYKIQYKREMALREGLITGFPQFLWFDVVRGDNDVLGDLELTLLPWEACLPSPYFMEPDGSDIHEVIRIAKKTKAELLYNYPNRKKAFLEYENYRKDNPDWLSTTAMYNDPDLSSDTRNNTYFDMVISGSLPDGTGQYTIAERVFTTRKQQHVYLDPNIEHSVVLPESWPATRVKQWRAMNPGYTDEMDEVVPTLWVSTIGSDGFVWENKQHKFQKQTKTGCKTYCVIPAVPLIVDMVDHIPTGKVEDLLPYVLMIAACETEGLSQVRKGTGRTTFIEEGAVRHPKFLRKELSAEEGVVILKKGVDLSRAIHVDTRNPNTAWFELADRTREQLVGVHRVNESMLGAQAPRQSAVAKDMEIEQGMSAQSPYLINFNRFTLDVTQMLCYMFPYFLNEEKIVAIDDEFGNIQAKVEINKAEEFDPITGSAIKVANDLTSADYRVVMVPGDDSFTARHKELRELAELFEAIGNSLFKMDPAMLGNFLVKWPNRYAREMGKWLAENAGAMAQSAQAAKEAEAQGDLARQQARIEGDLKQAAIPKVQIKMQPEDLKTAPVGFQVLAAWAEKQSLQATASTPTAPSAPIQPPAPAPAMALQQEG